MKLKHFVLTVFLSLIITKFSAGQPVIIDSCFLSCAPSISFIPSPDLGSFDADLMEWTGSGWIGSHTNANITIPPPSLQTNCRANFIGSGTSWTTGGEGFAMRLSQPLVNGQVYSFFFTYVSHGYGSDSIFSPKVYSNNIANIPGEVFIGSLSPAGYNWFASNFSFTANPSQNGHTWILVQTDASVSSGIVSAFCEDCSTVTGINNLNMAPPSIEVFPNPFIADIAIRLQSQNLKQATFIIKNIFGQTVFEAPLPESSARFDLSFLSKGIYFVEIIIDPEKDGIGGERTVKKIMKE
jgi:hypothetical protein